MKFSRRSKVVPVSDAFRSACALRRASRAKITDLTVSNPTRAALKERGAVSESLAGSEARSVTPRDASASAAAQIEYQPEAFGLLAARRQVAELWGRRGVAVAPEDIMLTSSTSEAYSYLLKLFCDSGDEVLIPAPSYPLFEQLTHYEHAKAVPYSLVYDGAWSIDLDDLRSRITPRTRAIIVVSPNNPTGNVTTRAEYRALDALGLPVISDEVFGAYTFDSPLTGGLQHHKDEQLTGLLIVLDGLSKFAGLPHLKLAWATVTGRPDIKAEALKRLEYIADTYLSVAAPVQVDLAGTLVWAAQRRTAIQSRVRGNWSWLRARASTALFSCLYADGGWSAVLRLPATRSEEQWCVALIEAGVLIQPGWYYDFSEQPMVVVSLLTTESELQVGINALDDILRGAD